MSVCTNSADILARAGVDIDVSKSTQYSRRSPGPATMMSSKLFIHRIFPYIYWWSTRLGCPRFDAPA